MKKLALQKFHGFTFRKGGLPREDAKLNPLRKFQCSYTFSSSPSSPVSVACTCVVTVAVVLSLQGSPSQCGLYMCCNRSRGSVPTGLPQSVWLVHVLSQLVQWNSESLHGIILTLSQPLGEKSQSGLVVTSNTVEPVLIVFHCALRLIFAFV